MAKVRTLPVVFFLVVPLTLVVVGLVWWRVSAFTQSEQPRASEIELPEALERLARTQAVPDPFSNDLESVIASIDEEWRRRIVLRQAEDVRLLWARASAAQANPEAFRGAPEEIKIGLDYLDGPLLAMEPGDLRYDMSDEAVKINWQRSLSLHLLRFAVMSGAKYPPEVFQKIAEYALKHLDWSHPMERLPIRVEASAILLTMEERGLLSDEQKAALHEKLADNAVRLDVKRGLSLIGLELPPP